MCTKKTVIVCYVVALVACCALFLLQVAAVSTVIEIGVLTAENALSGGPSTPASRKLQARYANQTLLAARHINEGVIKLDPPLPYGVNVSTRIVSTQGQGNLAALAALQTASTINSGCVIGGTTPLEGNSIATNTAAYNAAYLSMIATAQLNDTGRYPLFTRMRPADTDVGPAIAALMHSLGVRRICYTGAAEEYGSGGLAWWTTNGAAYGITFDALLFSADFTNLTQRAYATLETLIAPRSSGGFDCRIIYIHAPINTAIPVLQGAAALGILDNPRYAIVGDAEWLTVLASSVDASFNLRGVIGLVFTVPSGTNYTQWAQRTVASAHSSLDYATTPINPTEAIWYDTFLGAAQAVATLLARGTPLVGTSIQNTVRTQEFNGATGTMTFNSNFNRLQDYDVVNFPGTAGQGLRSIARFNSTSRQLVPYAGAPAYVWAGGASSFARDGATVLNKDALSPTQSAAFFILGFALNTLAAWIVCLLVEQVRFHILRNKWANRRGWLLWTILCAATQGVAGTWSVHVSALASLGWPTHNIYDTVLHASYRPAWVVGGLLISVVCSLTAFACASIGEFKANYSTQRGSGGGRDGDDGRNGSAFSDEHHSSDSPQKSGGGGGGISGGGGGSSDAKAILKYQTDAGPTAVRNTMNTLIYSTQSSSSSLVIAIWFSLGGACLAAGNIASLLTMREAITGPVAPGNHPVAALIFFVAAGLPIYTVALLLLFFYYSVWRIPVCVAALSVAFWGSLIDAYASSWQYSESGASASASTHGLWSDSQPVIGACVGAALVLILGFGSNLREIALSKSEMARYARRLEGERLAESRAKESALAECADLRRLIEMQLCMGSRVWPPLYALFIAESAVPPGQEVTRDMLESRLAELRNVRVVNGSIVIASSSVDHADAGGGGTPAIGAHKSGVDMTEVRRMMGDPLCCELIKQQHITTMSDETYMGLLVINKMERSSGATREFLMRHFCADFLYPNSQFELNIGTSLLFKPLAPGAEPATAIQDAKLRSVEQELLVLARGTIQYQEQLLLSREYAATFHRVRDEARKLRGVPLSDTNPFVNLLKSGGNDNNNNRVRGGFVPSRRSIEAVSEHSSTAVVGDATSRHAPAHNEPILQTLLIETKTHEPALNRRVFSRVENKSSSASHDFLGHTGPSTPDHDSKTLHVDSATPHTTHEYSRTGQQDDKSAIHEPTAAVSNRVAGTPGASSRAQFSPIPNLVVSES